MRKRLAWADLPVPVKAAVCQRTGEIVKATSHEGGYSPGMAATLTGRDDEVFVKAIAASVQERSFELYRQEAKINRLLPVTVPAPRMQWSIEVADWIVLAFEPGQPVGKWTPDLARQVTDLVQDVAVVPAPPSLPDAGDAYAAMDGWHRAVQDRRDLSGLGLSDNDVQDLARLALGYHQHASGNELVHRDIRRDNMVLLDGRLVLVDWPYAARGSAWVDLVAMLPSVPLEGGPQPEQLWQQTRWAQGVDPATVDAVIAGIAGYFLCSSVLPPPPLIDHVRPFQRAQGDIALAWLRQRRAC